MAEIDRTVELKVTGMTCNHCVAHVTEALQGLDGVKNVFVTLDPKGASTVTVVTDKELADDELTSAVSEAGSYTVEGIERDE